MFVVAQAFLMPDALPDTTLPVSLHIPTCWGATRVQCLAYGHLDMWTGGVGDQTGNPVIRGRPST